MSGDPAVAKFDDVFDAVSKRLENLFDAHEERLYRLARRLVSTREDANDLVQETFVRAAKHVNSVPIGLVKEEAWLVRVLVNIRRDAWRSEAVRKRSDAMLGAHLMTHSSTVESALITKRAVWAALDLLHPRRRAVVILHELDGLNLPTIASMLGLRLMTVRWHLSMGRRDLKRILHPFMRDMT